MILMKRDRGDTSPPLTKSPVPCVVYGTSWGVIIIIQQNLGMEHHQCDNENPPFTKKSLVAGPLWFRGSLSVRDGRDQRWWHAQEQSHMRSPDGCWWRGACVVSGQLQASCWPTPTIAVKSRKESYVIEFCARKTSPKKRCRFRKIELLKVSKYSSSSFGAHWSFYCLGNDLAYHYNDVIISAMASQITGVSIGLLNHLFRHRSKKTSELRVTGLCAGNSPVTGECPAQTARNAENVSIWWRNHVITQINDDKDYWYVFAPKRQNMASAKFIKTIAKKLTLFTKWFVAFVL